MRFGQQLRSSLIKDWYHYYISYDGLKDSLRSTNFTHTPAIQQGKHADEEWSEDDEKRFVNKLEEELDKVFTFQQVKSQEIIRRINSTEKEVNEVIARTQSAEQDERTRANAPSEDEYMLLEEDLSDIIADTAAGQDPPGWIRELTASHLVEAVPKFSKFIHGTASMFPSRINLLPFWMPQMDVDIRKPVSHNFGLMRPGHSTETSTSAALDEDSDEELDLEDVEDAEDVEDDKNLQRLRDARDALEQHEQERYLEQANGNGNVLDEEERMAHKPIAHAEEDYPLYDSDDEEEDLAAAKRVGGWSYRWKLSKKHATLAGDKILDVLKYATPMPRPTQIPDREGRMGIPAGRGVSEKRFKAPPGKKIHVPVRVEPKVSFAVERTFLAWLEFSIILGSIAAALLNFGDDISLASAWAFTIIAVIALFYSMGIYLWRVANLKKRRAVNYHDKWGPSALCAGLVVAVAISFVFRFSKGGEGGLKGI
ncbi:vacuolar transporter chaperone [Rachicladosporium monterosium]|uniref:Vacuolar transporter chaperone n=1 Tax=Rachicladosporium monterosium TaxID=1507873 RepID=A0ABR0LD85_9PEZI|nr:vacuolar transporter chaperone [Rachicladosporium monterosium]